MIRYLYCRGEKIRTSDLHVPNVARYQATLHPEKRSVNLEIFLLAVADLFCLLKGKSKRSSCAVRTAHIDALFMRFDNVFHNS